MPASLRLRDLTLEWGRRTYLMGIINVTPDSFSGDGLIEVSAVLARGREMLADGADIIDVGGESTRPGATPVAVDEELRRVLPAVEGLVRETGAVVSVDTMKSEVAHRALAAGAAMVNDVSALRADPDMASVVAQHHCPVVVVHGYDSAPSPSSRGHTEIISEVVAFFHERLAFAVAAGIARDQILVDPGFGFGKTIRQNLDLLARLRELGTLGQPLVIGPSRKGTIGRVLGGLPAHDRLEGTAAAVAVSIMNGADIVRVHDVHAMVRVARMTDAIVRQETRESQGE